MKEPKSSRLWRWHSSTRSTSIPVTFDIDLWPWHYIKVKTLYVIRLHLLYCSLVPGMMSASSVGAIVYEILPFVDILWSLTFVCDLQLHGYFHFHHHVVVYWYQIWFICPIEIEMWTKHLNKKLKLRHNDVITDSILMKFKYKPTKGISKWQIEFQFALI